MITNLYFIKDNTKCIFHIQDTITKITDNTDLIISALEYEIFIANKIENLQSNVIMLNELISSNDILNTLLDLTEIKSNTLAGDLTEIKSNTLAGDLTEIKSNTINDVKYNITCLVRAVSDENLSYLVNNKSELFNILELWKNITNDMQEIKKYYYNIHNLVI